MESVNNIYWKDLVELLRQNKTTAIQQVDFRGEMINIREVALLNRFGYRVPENLIKYNDDEIDFSDDPDITEEDLQTGKISWSVVANFNLDPEVKQWLKNEKIEMNKLIPSLIRNFYETVKLLKNNAAL
ncbi:MAG: hypothetical protein U0W24_17415 [Bacteroidales bacterium]